MILSFSFLVLSFTGTVEQRMVIRPLDLQREAGQTHLTSINQIATDGTHLYLRSRRHSVIQVVDGNGRVIREIGRSGEGPGEIPYGVLAMAVGGDRVWAIDMSRKNVHVFHENAFERRFPLPSFNVYFGHNTSNVFAGNQNMVVIPAHSRMGSRAAVFDTRGVPAGSVGELLPLEEDFPHVRGIHDSFWLWAGESWLAVDKFFPMVTRYDRNFAVVAQHQLSSPAIDALLEKIRDFRPNERFPHPPNLFSDAGYWKEDLFVMVRGSLHRIDLRDGSVTWIGRFMGEGPDFANVTSPTLNLYHFAFLNDRLYLAHPALMWNHDLWVVEGIE